MELREAIEKLTMWHQANPRTGPLGVVMDATIDGTLIPADQCYQVREGYEVGAAKVDADGNLQRIAELSEALEIRSADDVLEAAEKRIAVLENMVQGDIEIVECAYKERAEKAEAERDELAAELDSMVAIKDIHQNKRHEYFERAEKAESERDQALAASAAREIAMRDRAAKVADMFDAMCIRALPLSPDGQQALNEMLSEAWDEGYIEGDDYYAENPYRTQPSRSSDAGKSEDRG